MTLQKANEKAKAINATKSMSSAKVTRSIFGGYRISIEPIELTIIKNSIGVLASQERSFASNVGIKYGR